MGALEEGAGAAHGALDATQADLASVQDELANLYYKVCSTQGVTPQRVMLDHVNKGARLARDLNFKAF